mmetsp:Transcript_29578/g.72077  ORF Transcript_29578/g.72077 Transcript_29578/m.72077 type:complete len:150 (+) Transcript_29578:36-485(+)
MTAPTSRAIRLLSCVRRIIPHPSVFRPGGARSRWLSFARVAGEKFSVTFIEDGERVEASVIEGQSILEAAHDNEIELEGACDAQLACSTCHVILPQEIYDTLEEPGDEELDMLDLAMGVTDTSRLGCQIKLTKNMEGMDIEIPPAEDLR